MLIEVENMMEGLHYISLCLLAAFTIMVMKEQKKLHHFTFTVAVELLAQNAMNSFSWYHLLLLLHAWKSNRRCITPPAVILELPGQKSANTSWY